MFVFLDGIAGLLTLIAELTGTIGIITIVYAVLHTLYKMVWIETKSKKRFHQYEHTKRTLIQKIIFALDFFVAADLIKLSVVSTMQEIMEIALIVAIRTVLSWSLSKEVHLHEE